MGNAHELETTALDSVLSYEPDDLVVTVQAGVPLALVQEQLRLRNQWLPIEGARSVEGTIGGVIAADLNGPSRARYGSIRDMLLSARVVLADGTAVRSGSQVVKSVAGYDLHKVFVGSRGTLGVIIEATLRVAPMPERIATLAVALSPSVTAEDIARGIIDCSPAACIALGERLAQQAGCGSHPTMLVRFDGFEEDVAWQSEEWTKRFPSATPMAADAMRGAVDAVHQWPDAVRLTSMGLMEWLQVRAHGQSLYDACAGTVDLPSLANAPAHAVGATLWDRRLIGVDDAQHALRERLKGHFDPFGIFPSWRYE